MKKSIAKLYTVLFVAAICLPWLVWLIFGNKSAESAENRELAELPVISETGYEEFPSVFDDYVNDNMPFRDELIRKNSQVNLYGLKSATDDRVVLGKDGWMFLNDPGDGNTVGTYMGLDIYSEEQLAHIADNMRKTDEYLKARGKEFVILILPNKERVYSDKMPDYFGQPGELYKVKQVVDYLRTHTDVRVVYPLQEMLAAKETVKSLDVIQSEEHKNDEVTIYHKYDTHWNGIGAYVGAKALLDELGIVVPAIDAPSTKITYVDNGSADLAGMINLSKDFVNKEDDYHVSGYDSHDCECLKDDFTTEIIYKANDADERKLFIARDSFTSAMAPYVGSQFNESYMYYDRNLTQDIIEKENPDILVYEVVERYVYMLENFCISD